jgi:hypothetical protein
MSITNQPTDVAYPRVTNRFAITAFVLSILGFFTRARLGCCSRRRVAAVFSML